MGVCDATLNRHIATLRAMFNQARKDELITLGEIPGYFPMGEEFIPPRETAFIDEKWYAPLRAKGGLVEPMRSAFTLAYHNAVRVEEMKRLRWNGFDFKHNEIFLSMEVTKTGKSRIVPIPSDFDLKPGKPDELVCPIGECREKSWNAVLVRLGAGWYTCRKCGNVVPGATGVNARRMAWEQYGS